LKHKRHKHKATTTKKTASGQKSTAQTLPDGSSKTVVKNGGTSEESAQLSPAVAPDQAQHQRASTADLLAATDANLKRVTARKLTTDQQNTLEQIRTYMRQAKAAAAAGDTNRAQTLAYKARLLSDDLAGK
jgi:ribosomal protein S20